MRDMSFLVTGQVFNLIPLGNWSTAEQWLEEKLLSAQRAYQANTRVITSSNAVLDDTINLVR